MLVQQIREFCSSLMKHESLLTDSDKRLIENIRAYFKENENGATVDKNNLFFLAEQYKLRWDSIFGDKEQDYTLMGSEINTLWSSFAKLIAKEQGVSHLSILFYNLTNTQKDTLKDPADGSNLEETENLTNFYVGENMCLYRKSVLYLRMSTVKPDHLLGTTPGPTIGEYRALSVFELRNLHHCTRNGSVSKISTYNCLWEFMTDRIFPRLIRNSSLSNALFWSLEELVDSYHYLKHDQQRFELFKNKTLAFFDTLKTYQLRDVNCVYGLKIKYKERDHYLFEILIQLFDMVFHEKKFTLDVEFSALRTFLQTQKTAYKQCGALFVSLLVYNFNVTVLTPKTPIDNWDLENTLPNTLKDIYTDLNAYLNGSLPELSNTNFSIVYDDILRKYIRPRLEPHTLWSGLSDIMVNRSNEEKQWLEAVQDNKVASVSGYWFESELIIGALLAYCERMKGHKARGQALGLGRALLEECIRTLCNAKATPFEKDLRVNVLVARFLMEHTESELLSCLTSTNVDVAKKLFMEQCESYIKERIDELGYVASSSSSIEFFPSASKVELLTTKDWMNACTGLPILANKYNMLQLYHLEMSIKDSIQVYLGRFIDPILSVKQREAIDYSLRPNTDPIGASQ